MKLWYGVRTVGVVHHWPNTDHSCWQPPLTWTYIHEESWLHYRSGVKHEGPYHQTLPIVLLPASPNTHGFDTHLHHRPSKLWSMPSSARESISPTASSMGRVPASLTISNRFLNSAARLILGIGKYDPISAAIRRDLHWLPVPFSYSIQVQLHHEKLPGWPCTGVPDRAVPLREWHSSKAQPSVVISGSAPGPSISEGTIRSMRLLRLLTTK